MKSEDQEKQVLKPNHFFDRVLTRMLTEAWSSPRGSGGCRWLKFRYTCISETRFSWFLPEVQMISEQTRRHRWRTTLRDGVPQDRDGRQDDLSVPGECRRVWKWITENCKCVRGSLNRWAYKTSFHLTSLTRETATCDRRLPALPLVRVTKKLTDETQIQHMQRSQADNLKCPGSRLICHKTKS